jgi:glucokinase
MRGGVDLGGTKIQAVVVDARHRVRGEARLPTPQEGGGLAVAAGVAEAVREAAAAARTATSRLSAVGIGAPGDVERGGVLSSAPNLPGWDSPFPLGPTVARELGGVPVALGNDVQVATAAEFHLGAGRPYRTILGVFWGTGVGGGIVLDGRDWTGRGAAGEIGHVVIEVGGARCGCGRRGCMEAYAGRARMEHRARKLAKQGRKTKLFEIAEKRGRDRLTSGIWSRAAEAGDELALELLERAVQALGAGVASVCNVLDPEAVIVGGGLGVRFGQEYVKRIEQAMLPHLFADERPPAMHVARLGDLGGAIGGALLAASVNGRAAGRARSPGRTRRTAARPR